MSLRLAAQREASSQRLASPGAAAGAFLNVLANPRRDARVGFCFERCQHLLGAKRQAVPYVSGRGIRRSGGAPRGVQ